MNTRKFRTASIAATILLVMMVPVGMIYVSPLLAQSTETGEDTSSASQDYQEFQSCLSNAEVDGTVSEQQIRDCFAPIYNTGTGTGTDVLLLHLIALPAMKIPPLQMIQAVKVKGEKKPVSNRIELKDLSRIDT